MSACYTVIMKIKIAFVLGTAREGRWSEKVYDFVIECARKYDNIELVLADVKDYPQTASIATKDTSELKEKWKAVAKDADAFIIVSPEYNHGYPGELKMFLDNAYQEYVGKPFGIVGVSDGPIGGARMAEQLKLVLSAFQGLIINRVAYFANVNTLFEDGGIVNRDFYESRVKGVIDEVLKYSRKE
jgi:NAD(P)H-dependent FMN reductase